MRRGHAELATRPEVGAPPFGPRLPHHPLQEEREGLVGAPCEEDEGQGAVTRGVGHLGLGGGDGMGGRIPGGLW